MSHVVIGTAGHIDHGKTSLVRALTGRDTDTLRDERERGITIDIGFAFLGDHATIIDVPGHERFIKNMVSGVSTIDFVMLVVAADDGIMPQTREHMDILRLLGLKRGMVVLSKADMVDEDWLELVSEDVRGYLQGSFLEDAPLMVVDSLSGRGIPELKTRLDEELARLPERPGGGVFREVVDRAFNVHGHGTVVTGTVLGGELATGQEIEVHPGGHKGRVRSLQVHGAAVERVRLGDRAAVNLQGIQLDQVQRGCWLATPGILKPGKLLDVKLVVLQDAPPLKHRDRVRVHVGTAELLARVSLMSLKTIAPGCEGFGQLQLEEPTSTLQGDRFVLRRYSPQETIGGGEILDPHPRKHRPSARLVLERMQRMDDVDPLDRLLTLIEDPDHPVWSLAGLQEKTGATVEDLESLLGQLEAGKSIVRRNLGSRVVWLASAEWQELRESLLASLKALHETQPEQEAHAGAPLRQKLFRGVRWKEHGQGVFDLLTSELAAAGEVRIHSGQIALVEHEVRISPQLQAQLDRFREWLREQGCAAPRLEEMAQAQQITVPEMKRLLALALSSGQVIQITSDIFLHQDIHKNVLLKLMKLGNEQSEGFTVSMANSSIGASRRFMVPYLEALDAKGLTRREGNFRTFSTESPAK